VNNIIDNKNIVWLDKNKGYKNTVTSLSLQCKKCNHVWHTNFGKLHYDNSRCPKCTGFSKPSLNDIYKLLLNKKITWIDDDKGYLNSGKIYNFKCDMCSCEWKTSFDCIKNKNTGCPNCSSCKTEKLCRKYLEDKFKVKFSKTSPKWLKGLQLDGYNEDLKLAFEYNGKQHYKLIPYFHKSIKIFKSQQQRDKLKRNILKEKGVLLIDIPYIYNHQKEDKLYKFIDDVVEKLRIC